MVQDVLSGTSNLHGKAFIDLEAFDHVDIQLENAGTGRGPARETAKLTRLSVHEDRCPIGAGDGLQRRKPLKVSQSRDVPDIRIGHLFESVEISHTVADE